MQAAIFIVAVIAWAVAAYGFFHIAMAFLGVARLAPAGRRFASLMELGRGDFPAVRSRYAAAAEPFIARYGKGVKIFVAAFALFIVIVLVNILTGSAA